jgi:Uma2 family endonuclease
MVVTAAPKLRFSFQDYLQVDAESSVKHEFLDGMILAMAGGTPDHAALAAAVTLSLGQQLQGRKCRVYSEALRVRVQATKFAGYPDVTVVCGQLQLDPEDANTAINPAVVVEVLSPSTAGYDRGEKLRHYQQIPSLSHVVLVAHDTKHIEVWSRSGDTWLVAAAGPSEAASLPAIECTLDVDDVYRDPLSS